MMITQATFYEAPIPLKEPFVISLGPLTHANNVFVKVETDAGKVGWGEASPFPTIHGETMAGSMSIGRFLAQGLLGLNPCDHQRINGTMDRCIFGNTCIKSALEIACYDLAAQQAGQALYKYLGATKNRTLTTDYTISLGPVDKMVEKARWIKQSGFPVIKIKLGAGLEDVDRIAAISEAIGNDLPLRLDANQGWSVNETISILGLLEKYTIQHCEEPIDKRDYHELPRIRKATSIPIMADETCWDHHDARRLISLGAIDRINIKLSKTGGFMKALKIVDLAKANNIPLQVGGFLETRLGFTAAAHFGLLDGISFYDFDTPLMQTEDPIIGGIVYGKNGTLDLPETHGLGAKPSADYLENLISCVVA